jgi:hypothetical protein
LSTYAQKPQIAVSYKLNDTEQAKFFFQGIADEEAQKQILK